MPRLAALVILLMALGGVEAGAQPVSTLGAADAAPQVVASRMAGATVLLVEDELPWGWESNQQVLADLGVAYDTVGSSELASVELSRYATIIVASEQQQPFYDRLGKRMHAIERWLRHGARTLEVHAAFWDIEGGFDLPGQVHAVWTKDNDNVLKWPDDPLTEGLPHVMTGSYASHTSFERFHVVKAHVLITTRLRPQLPVMIDYCVGPGRVIATGQTVEFAKAFGWNFAPVLPQMISASALTPGCPL